MAVGRLLPAMWARAARRGLVFLLFPFVTIAIIVIVSGIPLIQLNSTAGEQEQPPCAIVIHQGVENQQWRQQQHHHQAVP